MSGRCRAPVGSGGACQPFGRSGRIPSVNGELVTEGRRAIGILEPSRERMERLSAWFHAEYARLLRFAYFVTGDRAAAEDLIQDAFVRLYRSAARIDEPTFGAYARRTIVNLNRSRWRRAVRERRALVSALPDSAAREHEPRDDVWRAILGLSPQQRACVALRYYEDMTEQQIAAALGLSGGAVKKHLNRAMTRLRGTLGERSGA